MCMSFTELQGNKYEFSSGNTEEQIIVGNCLLLFSSESVCLSVSLSLSLFRARATAQRGPGPPHSSDLLTTHITHHSQ